MVRGLGFESERLDLELDVFVYPGTEAHIEAAGSRQRIPMSMLHASLNLTRPPSERLATQCEAFDERNASRALVAVPSLVMSILAP